MTIVAKKSSDQADSVAGNGNGADTTAFHDQLHTLQAGGNQPVDQISAQKDQARANSFFGTMELWGQSIENAVTSSAKAVVDKVSSVEQAITDPTNIHNALDVGATLVEGMYNTVAKPVEQAGHWVAEHPGETAAIAGAVVLAGVAEVASGGLATGAIAAAAEAAAPMFVAASPAIQTAVVALSAAQTAEAVHKVVQDGSVSVLMNQQNMTPEQVQQARQQLEKDTGKTLLADAAVGLGLGVKAFTSAGEATEAATGSAQETASTADATSAADTASDTAATAKADIKTQVAVVTDNTKRIFPAANHLGDVQMSVSKGSEVIKHAGIGFTPQSNTEV